nr:MAG: replication polyprotein [Chemarfal virus 58]
MSRSRSWCFTLNNYAEADLERIRGLSSNAKIKFFVCGREIGESGTPHLQGYMYLHGPSRMRSVKELIGNNSVHVEAAKGSPEQAASYCRKDGDVFLEFGELPVKGKRNDLQEVKRALDNGSDMRDIADNNFTIFCQYRRALEAYISLRIMPRSWRTQVIWLYGATGTGKSLRAHGESVQLCGGDVAWVSDPSLTWFDGYGGQKGAIFDDFAGIPAISFLLRLWDRYPLRVPIKGGFVEWCPRIVWVTSNRSPRSFYGTDFQWAALKRRIDEVWCYEEDGCNHLESFDQ